MRTRREKGFTLLELIIAVAIAGLVTAGLVGVVNSQLRTAQSGHGQRAAQNAARSALLSIEQALQLAGYGMDGTLAFDLDRYKGPCPAGMGTCPRDAIDNADELVFYARNPKYWFNATHTTSSGNAWVLHGLQIASSPNTATLYAHVDDVFQQGQVLQAVCAGASGYAYFTVKTTSAATGSDHSVMADRSVQLSDVVAGDPFRRQDLASDGCFTSGTARVFLIDRYRFHVRPVLMPDGSYEPFLMLDRGLGFDGTLATSRSDSVAAATEQFVAEGVELFQVAYAMTNPNLALRGMDPGTAITFTQADVESNPGAAATSGLAMTTLLFPSALAPQAGQSLYDVTSWYKYSVGPPPAPQRLTDYQANIRAVRIGLTVRSPIVQTGGQAAVAPTPFFNMNALPTWVDVNNPYNRAHVETSVPVRNMTTRGINDF